MNGTGKKKRVKGDIGRRAMAVKCTPEAPDQDYSPFNLNAAVRKLNAMEA
jgi:hypothetical protein